MLTIWIIHRDAHHRAALARIAGAGEAAVLGGPDDRLFESASPPGVVVLGLCDDFERELEFVRRFAPRLRGSAWVLLGARADLPEARRLFDTLPASFVSYPPDPLELRRTLRAALKRRSTDSLSSRQGRDALRDRFARWFADIELPELMRAIDPRLTSVPVLVRGEEGTGRTLLARYVHAFGGSGDEAFVHVSCRGVVGAEDLREQIRVGAEAAAQEGFTVWLEDVDRLPLSAQRRVQDWVEFGLPDGTLRGSSVRWMAGAGDDGDLDAEPGLEPRLAEALSGITIRIPPLRDRPGSIAPFVADTCRAWASVHGQRQRSFSQEALVLLDAYPWPGNLHELEAVVTRTLSFTSADPVLPVHLRFPGDSSWFEQSFAPAPTRFGATPAMPPAPRPREETTREDLGLEILTAEEPEIETEPAATRHEAGVAGAARAPEAEEEIPEAEILPEDEWGGEIEEVLAPLDEEELEPLAEPALPAEEAEQEEAATPAPEPPGADAAEVAAFTPGPSATDLATAAAEAVLPPRREVAGEAPAPTPGEEADLRRLVRAVAHEVRNPLVSIRTFSELLPEHYDDAEFRTHFRQLVSQDVQRIDEAVTRLQSMVELPDVKSEPVDVAHLLESLLEERRDEIQARRLLVLKELDHGMPHALGDPLLLRDAFNGLIKRALDRVTDRGDIYVASKHHAAGLSGGPSLRVLLRYTAAAPGEAGTPAEPTRAGSESLDGVMAQTIVHSLGGRFTEDAADSEESVIVIDLPAPA